MPNKYTQNLTELGTSSDNDKIPIYDSINGGELKYIKKSNLIPAPVVPEGIYVNVKDYGAACDGTTDDTDAINDAIASLPAYGGTIFFPDFSKITSTITIPSYVNLLGVGRFSSGLAGNIDGPLVQTTDQGTNFAAQNQCISFRNMSFANSSTNANARAASIYNVSGFFAEFCHFQAAGGYGMFVKNTWSSKISDNYFGGEDGATLCLYILDNCNAFVVEKNDFQNAKGGLYINATNSSTYPGFGVVVNNNHFENIVGGLSGGFNDAACCIDAAIQGGTCMGNYFEACANGTLLSFQYDNGIQYGWTVGGNFFDGAVGNADFLYADGLSYSTILSNNHDVGSAVNPNGVYLYTHSNNNVIMPQYLSGGSGAAMVDGGSNNTKVGTW